MGGSLLTFDYVLKSESDTYALSCVMHHYKFVNLACILNTSHIHKREHWGRIEIYKLNYKITKKLVEMMYKCLTCNLTPSAGLLHPRVPLIKISANYRVGERVRYAFIKE